MIKKSFTALILIFSHLQAKAGIIVGSDTFETGKMIQLNYITQESILFEVCTAKSCEIIGIMTQHQLNLQKTKEQSKMIGSGALEVSGAFFSAAAISQILGVGLRAVAAKAGYSGIKSTLHLDGHITTVTRSLTPLGRLLNYTQYSIAAGLAGKLTGWFATYVKSQNVVRRYDLTQVFDSSFVKSADALIAFPDDTTEEIISYLEDITAK